MALVIVGCVHGHREYEAVGAAVSVRTENVGVAEVVRLDMIVLLLHTKVIAAGTVVGAAWETESVVPLRQSDREVVVLDDGMRSALSFQAVVAAVVAVADDSWDVSSSCHGVLSAAESWEAEAVHEVAEGEAAVAPPSQTMAPAVATDRKEALMREVAVGDVENDLP